MVLNRFGINRNLQISLFLLSSWRALFKPVLLKLRLFECVGILLICEAIIYGQPLLLPFTKYILHECLDQFRDYDKVFRNKLKKEF